MNKSKLKEFLEEISEGAKFINFSYISSEIYKIFLKCKVEESDNDNHNNYTKEWIRKFSQFTNTTWIVHSCFPNLKRLAYRKSFWCHRSAQNKIRNSDRTRNLECKAKIDFKVKIINKNTAKNDADLKLGLNMNINIDFNHSHLIHDPGCLNQLKSSHQSDSAFYKYFHDGYTPSMAKCYHELLLIEQYGQDSEYIDNASLNPTLRHIVYIFQKKRTRKPIDTNDIIESKVDTLQQTGHVATYNKCHQFVVIITPLMGRVVTEFKTKSVLIDVTPILSGPFVMMLYVPTPQGSLPIACAIFAERNVVMYERIFMAISSAIERNFTIAFEPMLVSIGNTVLKDALISIFPRIVVKPDRFQICREFWEFICDDGNNVETSKRHKIMQMFKSLIYASNIEEAVQIRINLFNNDVMKSCLQKLQDVWQDWEQWLGIKDFNGKHIEEPIIFIKEFLIQKCKSFSFCVIMDVVTNILESHFQKITLAYADNDVIAVHTKFLPKIPLSIDSVQRLSENEYLVPGDEPNTTYHLNTDSLCCDCKTGVKGRICEHLTSVLNLINIKDISESEDTNVAYKIDGAADKIKIENSEEADINFGVNIDQSVSDSDHSMDIKQEIDPLEGNYETVTMSHGNDNVDLKAQYEATMKGLTDEFRRLNKLFRENPNRPNMETMARLARELAKIRPAEDADFSNILVRINP